MNLSLKFATLKIIKIKNFIFLIYNYLFQIFNLEVTFQSRIASRPGLALCPSVGGGAWYILPSLLLPLAPFLSLLRLLRTTVPCFQR